MLEARFDADNSALHPLIDGDLGSDLARRRLGSNAYRVYGSVDVRQLDVGHSTRHQSDRYAPAVGLTEQLNGCRAAHVVHARWSRMLSLPVEASPERDHYRSVALAHETKLVKRHWPDLEILCNERGCKGDRRALRRLTRKTRRDDARNDGEEQLSEGYSRTLHRPPPRRHWGSRT